MTCRELWQLSAMASVANGDFMQGSCFRAGREQSNTRVRRVGGDLIEPALEYLPFIVRIIYSYIVHYRDSGCHHMAMKSKDFWKSENRERARNFGVQVLNVGSLCLSEPSIGSQIASSF